MKTIKVSEATDNQLDWLVATCEGVDLEYGLTDDERYSTRYELGSPLLEREQVTHGFYQSFPANGDDKVHASLSRAKLIPGNLTQCWSASASAAPDRRPSRPTTTAFSPAASAAHTSARLAIDFEPGTCTVTSIGPSIRLTLRGSVISVSPPVA